MRFCSHNHALSGHAGVTHQFTEPFCQSNKLVATDQHSLAEIVDIPRGNTESRDGARRRKFSREDPSNTSKQHHKLLHMSK